MIYTIDGIRRIAAPAASAHGVKSIRLSGSYAKGQPAEQSDIDLRVECGKNFDLFPWGSLYSDLQAAFQKNLDLVASKTRKQTLFAASNRTRR